jgi:hypothetical protein
MDVIPLELQTSTTAPLELGCWSTATPLELGCWSIATPLELGTLVVAHGAIGTLITTLSKKIDQLLLLLSLEID